jgi:ketosteroid isomerase-like protein
MYAAWQRGDYSSTDWAHSEIETVMADGPAPGRWRGRAGVAEALRAILNAWEDFRADADEFRELDDERVLVLTRRSGRGKTSGLELDKLQTRGATLFHLRDGRVTKMVVYWERETGLDDLGIRPGGKAADRSD